MKRENVMRNARLAGEVRRYHTWMVHKEQTVGLHTWQMMRIYIRVFGDMSPAVSTYMVGHDAGEFHTGDLPYPTKKKDPELAAKFDEMETLALVKMNVPRVLLNSNDKLRVKLCDLIEMWEYGMCEVMMGNQFAVPIVDGTLADIQERAVALKRHEVVSLNLYMKEMEHVLGYRKADRAGRRRVSARKGRAVRQQLEEAWGRGRVHDARKKDGSSRRDDEARQLRRVPRNPGRTNGRAGRNHAG